MPSSWRPSGKAFTLVEALVVIAVIALLIALAIPTLRFARSAAVSAKCVTNARSCAAGLNAYTMDNDEMYPYFPERRRLSHAFSNGGYSLDYFAQSFHWPLVARQYLSGNRFLTEAQCPADPLLREDIGQFLSQYPNEYVPVSGYRTAYGSFSDPAYWVEGLARQTPEPPQWVFRPVRVSEAVFPADKGFLVEPFSHHAAAARSDQRSIRLGNPQAAHLTFSTVTVDGAGSMRRPAINFLTGFRGGTSVLQTSDGIRGRDIRY